MDFSLKSEPSAWPFFSEPSTSTVLLVGGWTNPIGKYARQIGSFPPRFGVKIKKYLKPPPRLPELSELIYLGKLYWSSAICPDCLGNVPPLMDSIPERISGKMSSKWNLNSQIWSHHKLTSVVENLIYELNLFSKTLHWNPLANAFPSSTPAFYTPTNSHVEANWKMKNYSVQRPKNTLQKSNIDTNNCHV